MEDPISQSPDTQNSAIGRPKSLDITTTSPLLPGNTARPVVTSNAQKFSDPMISHSYNKIPQSSGSGNTQGANEDRPASQTPDTVGDTMVDAASDESDHPTSQQQTTPDTEKPSYDVEELVASKEYFVPIKKSANKHVIIILTILLLVAVAFVAGYYVFA